MTSHEIIKRYIDNLQYSHSLVLIGSAGLGKTEVVFSSLKSSGYTEKVHFKYLANYISPKGFVELLKEINELKPPRILILDDIETTLKNPLIVSLLKGCLWEADGKRRVIWKTNRESIEFEFLGKIIIILNYLSLENPQIVSLVDRCSHFEIKLTKEEITQLLLIRAKRPFANIPLNKREEIAKFVIRNGYNSKKFSLRILPKAYHYFLGSPNHWQELLFRTL